MSESCTLYCKVMSDDVESFIKRLDILAPSTIEQDGADRWATIVCTTRQGTVNFNRLFFTQVADRFAKLRWTTIVKVQRKLESHPEEAKKVDDHLEHTEMIIGVVAEPGFDDIDKLSELIGILALEFDALIFNGSEFMDFDGSHILSL